MAEIFESSDILLSEAQLSAIVKDIDSNADGTISRQEVETYLQADNTPFTLWMATVKSCLRDFNFVSNLTWFIGAIGYTLTIYFDDNVAWAGNIVGAIGYFLGGSAYAAMFYSGQKSSFSIMVDLRDATRRIRDIGQASVCSDRATLAKAVIRRTCAVSQDKDAHARNTMLRNSAFNHVLRQTMNTNGDVESPNAIDREYFGDVESPDLMERTSLAVFTESGNFSSMQRGTTRPSHRKRNRKPTRNDKEPLHAIKESAGDGKKEGGGEDDDLVRPSLRHSSMQRNTSGLRHTEKSSDFQETVRVTFALDQTRGEKVDNDTVAATISDSIAQLRSGVSEVVEEGCEGNDRTEVATQSSCSASSQFLSCLISAKSEEDINRLKNDGNITIFEKIEWSSSSSISGHLILYRLALNVANKEETGLIYVYPSCYDVISMKRLKAKLSVDGTSITIYNFPVYPSGESVEKFTGMMASKLSAKLPLELSSVIRTIRAPNAIYAAGGFAICFQLEE